DSPSTCSSSRSPLFVELTPGSAGHLPASRSDPMAATRCIHTSPHRRRHALGIRVESAPPSSFDPSSGAVASCRAPSPRRNMWGYRMKTTLASAVLALMLVHSPPAHAFDLQGPFFIFIPGVHGEATQKKHSDEIEAFNFSETWRQSTTGGGAGGGASKPTL